MNHSKKIELEINDYKKNASLTLDYILSFYRRLQDMPISEPQWKNVKEKSAQLVEYVPPEQGRDYESLLKELFTEYIPAAMNFPSSGFMGFIPSTGLFQSAVAEFIASSTNRYVGHSYTSPFLAQLESNVIRWFATIIGYSTRAKGVFTSGGSIANLSAIILARNIILKNNISRGTLYMSDQTHHSLAKGAFCAGFIKEHVRIIPSDENLKIDLELLRKEIQKDKAKGLIPFLAVGNLGTTNTGAIDPLLEMADICENESMWFHVDAAYGGFFNITQEGHQKSAGFERADSVIMDPLKSLFLPLGYGTLIVKEGKLLDLTFSFDANYFPEKDSSEVFWDSAHMSMELSRPFRGLAVWLPIKTHGLAQFRTALDEKLQLSKKLCEILKDDPDWDVVYPPELSLMAISIKMPDQPLKKINALNKRMIEEVKKINRVYLTGTSVKNRYLIRICILNLKTHEEQISWLLEDLKTARKIIMKAAP